MHSWLELWYFGREKAAEALRGAEGARLGQDGRSRAAPRPRDCRTVALSRGEILTVRLRRAGLRVTCFTGRVWATKSGCPFDSLLLPAQSALFRGRGTLVFEALRSSSLKIEREEAAPRGLPNGLPRLRLFRAAGDPGQLRLPRHHRHAARARRRLACRGSRGRAARAGAGAPGLPAG